MDYRDVFDNNLAQSSVNNDFIIDVKKAEGSKVWDYDGKEYIDLLSGISVANCGHRHPKIIEAVKKQIDQYCHVMVYGEFVQRPQLEFINLLLSLLPKSFNDVFLVNSGSEAIDGAIKLACKYTSRSQTVCFSNTYHGSTIGAIGVLGNAEMRKPYNDIIHHSKILEYNNIEQLNQITDETACVIIEPIQTAGGIICATKEFIEAVFARCKQTSTLIIYDEIQNALGRTGKMFAFEHFELSPDILCLAKGIGGGFPLGCFVSSKEIMSVFKRDEHPLLGHASTFGGHPVSCAAATANIKVILEEKLLETVNQKADLFINNLKNKDIVEVRNKGLMIAMEFANEKQYQKHFKRIISQGVITYGFLFNHNCIGAVPALNIPDELLIKASNII